MEQIKLTIADLLVTAPAQLRSGHFLRLLSTRLGHRYALLSDASSTMEGCNLKLYVIRQRVAAAQQLLRDTLLPVGRIARQLGYSNLGHRSRHFQRKVGISPSEYRRQLAENLLSPLLPAGSEEGPQDVGGAGRTRGPDG